MKKALLTFLQFVLFLVTFAAGSFVAPMRMREVLSVQPHGTHIFIWDGVLWAVLLLLVILVFEAARKHIRSAAPWTLLAFALALLAGLALKLGFMTV
jgi:hypothetical protein